MADGAVKKSNYEITRDLMEVEFCKYDQAKMIEKFQLEHDEDFLYIAFIGQTYRINRGTGKVERVSEHGEEPVHADYNESMSIFDLLCYSKDDCHLAGEFCVLNSLRSTIPASLGTSMSNKSAELFDRYPQELERALISLGGEKGTVGDISYQIKAFDCLPIVVQFWQSDEEFPASVKLLWDKNTLDFMHYETTYYVAGHLMKRLAEMIESQKEK